MEKVSIKNVDLDDILGCLTTEDAVSLFGSPGLSIEEMIARIDFPQPALKPVKEIANDEVAKEVFYKFSAGLLVLEGRKVQSKQDFYKEVYSKESLGELHDVVRLVDCLRKLGYGV